MRFELKKNWPKNSKDMSIFYMSLFISLNLHVCKGNAQLIAQDKELKTRDQITKLTSEILNNFQNKVLFMDITPQVSDHRGSENILSFVHQNFMEEVLPFGDTYIPLIGDFRELPLPQKWIIEVNGLKHLVVNLDNWNEIPNTVKEYAIYQLYLNLYGFTTYKAIPVTVAESVDLFKSNTFQDFEWSSPEGKWFQKWSKEVGKKIDTNCFALATQASGFEINYPRTIQPDEFESILKSHYEKISEPHSGDILVLKQNGYTIHAAVFMGYSVKNIRKKIFLSKNGRGMGVPLFIDEYTLLNKNYPDTNESSYWRLRK